MNSDGTACETLYQLPLIPFPFLIICLILALVSIGGFLKDRKSLILTNIISLWGPIEYIAYITQLGLAFIFSNEKYAALSLVALIFYFIINLTFCLYFALYIKRNDEEFRYWHRKHSKTSTTIIVLSGLLSFKLLKLHYSFFFGHDNFKAKFKSPFVLQKAMIAFTIAHIILSNGVIIAFDLSGILFSYEWGT